MAGFESPHFKKQVAQTRPMKEFSIGDPDDYPIQGTPTPSHHNVQQFQAPDLLSPEEEARLNELRRQKSEGPRISEPGKKRIEILSGIGRLTKDIVIGEHTFSLRTLKTKESEEATRAIFATAITQIEAAQASRKQQLARSIYKVDGIDVDLAFGTSSLEDRTRVLDELEDIIVEALWSGFVAMKDEVRTKFGISTEVQAKEVLDDLKK